MSTRITRECASTFCRLQTHETKPSTKLKELKTPSGVDTETTTMLKPCGL